MSQWFTSTSPIAIYGLAANPPHRGHWRCVEVLIENGFKVAVVPSFSHAFGKKMAPFETRIKWLNQAALDFKMGPLCWIWSVEKDIAASKKKEDWVYSIEVLDCARHQFKGVIKLAVGPDNMRGSTLERFHSVARIKNEYGLVEVPEVKGIRSTVIRTSIVSDEVGQSQLDRWVGPSIALDVLTYFSSTNGCEQR